MSRFDRPTANAANPADSDLPTMSRDRARRQLEICAYSVSDARLAASSGADRIELCAGRSEAGTTTSIGTLECAQERVPIPVFPIVRPRGGDFCYDRGEFDAMCRDVRHIVRLGFPGLVTGLLDADGSVALDRMRTLMELAGGVEVTFHKAFDSTPDQVRALDELAELGVERVLTSGGAPDVVTGHRQLERLLALQSPVSVMPGGGVRPGNVQALLSLGVTQVHSSAIPPSATAIDPAIVAELAALVHA